MPCFVFGKLISNAFAYLIPLSDYFLTSSHVASVVLGYREKRDRDRFST